MLCILIDNVLNLSKRPQTQNKNKLKDDDFIKIIKGISADLVNYDSISLVELEKMSKSDVKLEEQLFRILITSLPRDIEILKIDLKKQDWQAYLNSLKKLNSKVKDLAKQYIIDKCDDLQKNYELYHQQNLLVGKTHEFILEVRKLIDSIEKLV